MSLLSSLGVDLEPGIGVCLRQTLEIRCGTVVGQRVQINTSYHISHLPLTSQDGHAVRLSLKVLHMESPWVGDLMTVGWPWALYQQGG